MTNQQIIDELVSDIDNVLRSNVGKFRIVWWRGRLSGIHDAFRHNGEQLNFTGLEAAFKKLGAAEARLND